MILHYPFPYPGMGFLLALLENKPKSLLKASEHQFNCSVLGKCFMFFRSGYDIIGIYFSDIAGRIMKIRKHLFRDAIIGFAIGDALGAPAEFGERWMRDLDPVHEMRSGGIFEVPIGGWTDDTSMTLATLDSLSHGYNAVDIMNRFVSWLRTGKYSIFDEPIGIGKQILRAIEHYEANRDIHACGCSAETDNGNGSLMRILPLCLYCYQCKQDHSLSEADIIGKIHETSSLTHSHPRSLIACGMYYFMIESLLEHTGDLIALLQKGILKGIEYYSNADTVFSNELQHYSRALNLDSLCQIPRDQINSSGYVIDTFEAVLWSLITTDTYRSALLKAVNLGLDTDTIAAIAGGLAGLYYGYSSIPAEWIAALAKRNEIEALCEYFDAKQTEV